jgi:hypothetical protein
MTPFSLILMHGTKYQQCLSFVFVLGFQTIETLNSYDRLLLHLVPTSISILHHTLAKVYNPLYMKARQIYIYKHQEYWKDQF